MPRPTYKIPREHEERVWALVAARMSSHQMPLPDAFDAVVSEYARLQQSLEDGGQRGIEWVADDVAEDGYVARDADGQLVVRWL